LAMPATRASAAKRVLDVAGDQLPAAQAVEPSKHRCGPPVAAAPLGGGQPVGQFMASEAGGAGLAGSSRTRVRERCA
jgi:hypothetical protein